MGYVVCLRSCARQPHQLGERRTEHTLRRTLPVQDYTTVQWIAQKVDGAYADATMDIVIVNAGEPDDDEEELERMSVCARTCVCVDSLPSSASPTTQLFE